MWFLWGVNGIFYGLPIGFQRDAYGVSIGFLRDFFGVSHGISFGFL